MQKKIHNAFQSTTEAGAATRPCLLLFKDKAGFKSDFTRRNKKIKK